MSGRARVSVVINNHNYGRFLRDAIDSALAQTYPDTEVVVVDDGSTDESADVIRSFSDRVVARFKENGGQASAFNVGVAASSGDIVCFLDADDMFAAGKVERIVQTLERDPSAGYCYDRVVICDAHMSPTSAPAVSDRAHVGDFRARIRSGRLGRYLPMEIPATSGLSFRRSVLDRIYPMPESESCTMCENYMKYIAVGLTRGFFLDTAMTFQRIHGDNLFTRDRSHSMTARLSLMTGYWLYRNFPELTAFADTQVALGLAARSKAGPLDPKYAVLVRDYLRRRGPIGRGMVVGRAWAYRLTGRPHAGRRASGRAAEAAA